MISALVLAATLTIEDYASMPHPQTPRLSPDGTRVVYVLARPDLKRSAVDPDVWLVSANGAVNRPLTQHEASDTNPRWSPDGKRIAFLSDRDGGRNQIFLIDPDGGEPKRLTSEPMPIREFEWSPDGKSIAFLRFDEPTPEEERRIREKDDARVVGENRRHVHLHIIDVAGGTVRRITSGPFSIWRDFSWSPDGQWIAIDRAPGISLDDLFRSDVWLVSAKDGALRPLVARAGIDRGPVFSPDGKLVAFTSGGGVHDWLIEHEIHVVPAEWRTGDPACPGRPDCLPPTRNVSKEYGRTPESLLWSDDSKSIWFEGQWNTTRQLFRVNADGTGFTNTTKFEGMLTDIDVQGARTAWVQQSLTEPPEVHVDGRRVTNHNAAWRNRTLGETRLIRWKNPKDGLEIEALLTLPVGYTPGKRVPLLTFIHGGPASAFEQGFLGYHGGTYAPQVLAARGFAVLRPNPRGTGGYGLAFRRANRNDWAVMPWLDIEAGIDTLIADGIADPNRLGVMGWSYGGYLAAWVLGQSTRFRAFSIGAPVTDLLSFHGTADIRDFLPHYFDKRETPAEEIDEMRHPPLSTELLRSQSPAWHLKPTKAKVLIQHGENDDRVPIEQGILLYRLLDELGVDVTMVIYPRSGHSLREPKLKMDVMRRNVEFFSRVILSREDGEGSPDRAR